MPTVVTMFAASELDQGTISVQAAAGVIVAVVGATWWLSGKLRQLEDGIKEVNKRIDGLPGATKQHKPKEEEY